MTDADLGAAFRRVLALPFRGGLRFSKAGDEHGEVWCASSREGDALTTSDTTDPALCRLLLLLEAFAATAKVCPHCKQIETGVLWPDGNSYPQETHEMRCHLMFVEHMTGAG